ncbi:MAG: T9SS type A sorting domain-containing protein [Bacteroidota bacterium]
MKENIFRLLFVLITISGSLCSQTIKFNNLYTGHYISNLRNIIEYNNGYVVCGGGWDSIGSPEGINIILSYIDSAGNELWSKDYGDTLFDYYHGVENSFIRTNDGYFALAGSKENATIYGAYLCKFDQNLDTIWKKEYFIDTTAIILYGCCTTEDKGFALVGVYGEFDYYGDMLLIKTDSLGNLQWYKLFGATDAENGYKVLQMPDKGYLLGGWSRSWGSVSQANRGQWYFVRTDSLGNSNGSWFMLYGNPLYSEGRIGDMLMTKDSNYIAIGSYAPTLGQYKDCIIKFDENLDIIWERFYDFTGSASFMFSTVELTDGSLIAAGGLYNSSAMTIGTLHKLSADGDVMWRRVYAATDTSDIVENNILSLAHTSDNGFAMSGYIFGPFITPSQQLWVIKTDSLGCDGNGSCADTAMFISAVNLPDTVCAHDTTWFDIDFDGWSAPYIINVAGTNQLENIFYPDSDNCYITRQVYIVPPDTSTSYSFNITLIDPWGQSKTEIFSVYAKNCGTGIHETTGAGKAAIYPNPANTTLFVQGKGIQHIVLSDLSGKDLITQPCTGSKTELDVSGLARGIYIVKVVTEKGVVSEKVVLQ